MSLKVEEDQDINIVFTVVTRISARRHFWTYELRSWCFEFELVFRVKDQSFKDEDDLRTLCLRKHTRGCSRRWFLVGIKFLDFL